MPLPGEALRRGLRSAAMLAGSGRDRDLSTLVVPAVGAVVTSDDPWEPVRLIDAAGVPVAPAAAFLKELQASGRSAATQLSYAMDLLRWFRFGWVIGVWWDHATRVEVREFCRWLAEQAPMLDHTTLRELAFSLGGLFWRDLERHHPGISSLHLAPEVAAAWKQRVLTKTRRATGPDGQIVERRAGALHDLAAVRAFYLDIAQWAMEDPARWGPWAPRRGRVMTSV